MNVLSGLKFFVTCVTKNRRQLQKKFFVSNKNRWVGGDWDVSHERKFS